MLRVQHVNLLKNVLCFLVNLKLLLGCDYTKQEQLKIKKHDRIQVLELLILYYEIQIQGFKKPLSYQVLQEVFASY